MTPVAGFTKLRFKRDDGTEYPNTKPVKLSSISHRITRKNAGMQTTRPLTIASLCGFVDQRDYFNKVVASDNLEGYYLLKNGEFAYNKSYSVGFDYGAIKRLDRYDQGALSTLYICFALATSVNSDYMVCYFDSQEWKDEVAIRCAEGARNHGLLNIPVGDFFDITLNIHTDPDEQRKIADFLTTVDEKIAVQKDKLAALKVVKRGMLQKMFPKQGESVPELRFPGFAGDWEQRKFGELCSIVTKQTGFDYTATIKNSLLTEASEDTLPYLQTKNFTGVTIDYNTDYYIPKSVAKEFPKINLDEKCLLFSIVGASVGNIGFFPGDKHCFLSGAICVAKLLNQDDADFLYHYMSSECGQSQIRTCTKGGAQATITIEDIRAFDVLLPSVTERTRIGALLTSLDNTITLHQRELETWETIKKGLMQRLFAR